MAYVDGFVLAVRKDRLEEYKRFSAEMSHMWMDHGATAYVESVGDDVPYGERTSFPRSVEATDDEVVVLAWITYPSKEVRDACNARMMEQPMPENMPFDGKRMFWGGFSPFIQLGTGA